jgi:hypothetical protein
VDVGRCRPVGETVTLTGSFRDRLGYVIAAGRDSPTAALAAADALSLLRARLRT